MNVDFFFFSVAYIYVNEFQTNVTNSEEKGYEKKALEKLKCIQCLLMLKLHRCWTCSNFKHSLSLHLKIQFISFVCCMCSVYNTLRHLNFYTRYRIRIIQFFLLLLFLFTIEFLCMECTIIVWFNILECYPQCAIRKSIWNMLSNIIVNSIDFCWMRCRWFYHFSILIIYIYFVGMLNAFYILQNRKIV